MLWNYDICLQEGRAPHPVAVCLVKRTTALKGLNAHHMQSMFLSFAGKVCLAVVHTMAPGWKIIIRVSRHHFSP